MAPELTPAATLNGTTRAADNVMKAKLVTAEARAAVVERDINSSQLRVEKYEKAFRELAIITGIDGIPEVMRAHFVRTRRDFVVFTGSQSLHTVVDPMRMLMKVVVVSVCSLCISF